MNENTIFQGGSPTPPQAPPATPVAKQAVPAPATPIPAKQTWGPGSPPPAKNGFPFSKIIKAIIGFLIVAIIGFVIIHFVLPNFAKKDEKVTLSYWGLWESDATLKIVIEDFQKQNPNITVNYSKQDIKQYRERVVTRMQNNTGPDIYLFHNTWLLQMKDYLLPLPSDTISKDEFERVYYPVVKEDLTKTGAIYGIPSGIDTLALFVNTEMFSQAGIAVPTTWQDFNRVARLLTVKDEQGKIITAGASLGTFDNVTHAPDIISLLLSQNGADLKNLSDGPESIIDALDFYADFAKGDGKVWDDTLDPSVLAFAKGNLGMYFGFSWDIFTIKALTPDLSFQVVPVPHLPGRNTTIASYWASGVSVKSTHQKEALAFVKFLSQKTTAEKLFLEESKTRLFGELYARRDLAETLKSNTLIYPFVSQAQDASSSYFASDTYDNGLNSQMNGYLGNAVRSVLNDSSTESAVETLIKGVEQVLSQYSK